MNTTPAMDPQEVQKFQAQQLHAKQISGQFLEAYYRAFREDRASLLHFYTQKSTINWENRQFHGFQDPGDEALFRPIPECFERFSAAKLEYFSMQNEVQITPGDGVLTVVTGHVRIDGAEPLGFTQVFLLMPSSQTSWYIHNEVFKFALAG